MKKRKILLIVFIILSIGLLMVYSSSHIWAQYKENDSFYYFKRQAIFVIVGLLLLFFFSNIYYKCKGGTSMNNNIIKDSASDFPPLERLSVIELLVVSTNKKEFLDAVNKLLSEESKKETLPPQEESTPLPEDTKALEDSPKEETLSSTPGEASIYDSKYTNLVNQDKLTHPRDEVLTMDIPEEPINELAVTFDKELDNSVKEDSSKVKEEPKEANYTSPDLENFIPEEQEEHKVLERKINNPWADSGARTVSPGELNF